MIQSTQCTHFIKRKSDRKVELKSYIFYETEIKLFDDFYGLIIQAIYFFEYVIYELEIRVTIFENV